MTIQYFETIDKSEYLSACWYNSHKLCKNKRKTCTCKCHKV